MYMIKEENALLFALLVHPTSPNLKLKADWSPSQSTHPVTYRGLGHAVRIGVNISLLSSIPESYTVGFFDLHLRVEA
jgi:hypothetical protein